MHHDCVLILHKDWVEQGTTFQKDYNCYVVGYTHNIGKEIADIINVRHEQPPFAQRGLGGLESRQLFRPWAFSQAVHSFHGFRLYRIGFSEQLTSGV